METITEKEKEFTADLTRRLLVRSFVNKEPVEINLMDLLTRKFRKD